MSHVSAIVVSEISTAIDVRDYFVKYDIKDFFDKHTLDRDQFVDMIRKVAQESGHMPSQRRLKMEPKPRGTPLKLEQMLAFIVHGHDEKLLFQLKNYLQNTLKCPEPIILKELPDGGRTVIEKFEDCVDRVNVAIVLLTPDDMGRAVWDKERPRARQNVIFELGYFIGKFGRLTGRTILLHQGNLDELEIPSDLRGVVYIPISDSIAAVGERLRLELINAGKYLDEDTSATRVK